MADLSRIQTAIQALTTKVQTLREAVTALREAQVGQEALDDIATRLEEAGAELDEIIADARGDTGQGGLEGGTEGTGEPGTAGESNPETGTTRGR